MTSSRKKSKYRVAVLGATGAVGQEMLKILEERDFPVETLFPLASERSAGKVVGFKGRSYEVRSLDERSFKDIDLVLASAGASVSRLSVPQAVKDGAVVIDNTAAFRMDPKVPLVIPEINGAEIRKHKGIIANPNCSTIIMLLPLYPLDEANRIRAITAATYQSASGAGARAMEELRIQTGDVLAKRPALKNIFPHQIAFNVFSHNSPMGPTGFNEEETKMIQETHKILGRKNIAIRVTCVRVPVLRAHTEALFVEFQKPMNPSRARRILSRKPYLKVVDDPHKGHFPMPIEASGRDEILVGRIRQDLFSKKVLGLLVSGDQLRKGAALNAVQIAETLCGL